MKESMTVCTFELEDKTKAKLEKLAEAGYRSLAAQIRMIIEEFLASQEK